MCWTMPGVRGACITAATAVRTINSKSEPKVTTASAELVPSRNDYADLPSETDTLFGVCAERGKEGGGEGGGRENRFTHSSGIDV